MDACVVSGYLIIYNKKNRHMEQEERMYQVPLEMICRHDRTAEVCRAAVEEDGWQLENVPEEVKTPELCRKALETEAGFGNDRFRLVQHIPSPEVCMEVLKECSKVCPEELYGVAASIRPAAGRQVHQRPARAPANAETGAGGG